MGIFRFSKQYLSSFFIEHIKKKSNSNIKLVKNPNSIVVIQAEVLPFVVTKMMDANKNTLPIPRVI